MSELKKTQGFKIIQSKNEILKQFLVITLGTLIVSIGVYFFKFPNHFATGGVTGMAVLLQQLLGISQGMITTILNLVLLVLGFLIFGKSFGFKTAYSTVLLSVTLILFEKVYPLTTPMTDQPIMELFFAILLTGLGQALLFNTNASTGGTDVIAMILKKYFRIEIGNALFFTDILVIVSTFFVFGPKVGLFSLLGLLTNTLIVNQSIESINMVKYFTIITSKPEEIGKYINLQMKRGATKIQGKGIFTEEDKTVIFTVVGRDQAVHLRDYIKSVDPESFVMITNTSQIIGKGFKMD